MTRRREVFYWLAVIFTFAMGTALGDLFATTFHLGYFASAFVFTALICVPLVAWRLGVNPVLTFWVAYMLTRPIGASFADYFGMPKDISGLGLGHGAVSVVTLVLVVASFIYLSRSGIDQPEEPSAPAAASSASRRTAAARAIRPAERAAWPAVRAERPVRRPARYGHAAARRTSRLGTGTSGTTAAPGWPLGAGCCAPRGAVPARCGPATLTLAPAAFGLRTPGSLTVVSSVDPPAAPLLGRGARR